MNISFLFPGNGSPYDAVDNWVLTLGRFTRKHSVRLVRTPAECSVAGFHCDLAFAITEPVSYPTDRLVADLETLKTLGIPSGIVYNGDRTPVAVSGGVPSFVWTKSAWGKLGALKPILLRQPVFPPVVDHEGVALEPLVATFGHVEPKKCIWLMAAWAQKVGVKFRAYGPDALAGQYSGYIKDLRHRGVDVVIYSWEGKVEDLAPLFREVSHFLFVLPRAKGGSGGSPTSPRYASMFNRPVIVVDDEATFMQDGYYVFRELSPIEPWKAWLAGMQPPNYSWNPDAYLDALVRHTLGFYGRR